MVADDDIHSLGFGIKMCIRDRDNDLYAVEVASGREVRYTTDGSDVIKNGYASWLYYLSLIHI